MKNFIYKVKNILEEMIHKIRKIFKSNEVKSGFIKFNHGTHEIFVDTKRTPESVWIHIDSTKHSTCSEAECDMFSTVIVHNGFIIKADIKSNEHGINWMIK